MNEQRICFIVIVLYGLLSLSNGQQQPFPNFGQLATQAQRNPATFMQNLQNRQAATATFGAGGAGVPAQTAQGQIRTVTVPVLPAPGTQFGTAMQTQTRTAQTDGPIPRFAQGATMIGRPFTQFGPVAATQARTTGFNNAAMLARQRQIAMMRQNAQAQALAQAQARQQAAQIRPSFDRFGLGENGQMLLLSNRAANDISSARNIDRRRFIARTNSGRPASLLTAFALQTGVLLDARARARAALANGGQRGRGTNQQATRTTTTTSTRNRVAPGGRTAQSRFITVQGRNGMNGVQRGNGFGQRTTTTVTRTNGGSQRVNGAAQRINGAAQRVNGAAQRVNGAAQRVNGATQRVNGGTQKINGAFMRTNGIGARTNGGTGRQTVTVREETRTRAGLGPMMRPPQQPQLNAGVFPPFAPQPPTRNPNIGGGANQRQIQNQQALARMRAAGGLPPFAVMGAQQRPPFGMFPPGRFPRPAVRPTMTVNTNTTTTTGTAGALWNPDVRMPGMIRPPGGAVAPPFPGMFPPGFVGGRGANRITSTQTGRVGFTGASNALFPGQARPVFNAQDPRIGVMPPLANTNLMGIGSQQRPFPSTVGVLRRPAGAGGSTVTRTTQTETTNNIAAPQPFPGGGVVPLNVADAAGTRTTSTAVDGTEGSVTTVTETTITKIPIDGNFPGIESNAAALGSTSGATSTSSVDLPVFPGMEAGGSIVTDTSGPEVPMFPGTNDLNTITTISNSVFPGSSSSSESFVRPPPPPVFPSSLIETGPVNVDTTSTTTTIGRDPSFVSSADLSSSSIPDGMSTPTVGGAVKIVKTVETSEQPLISTPDMTFPFNTADTMSTIENTNSFITSNDGVFPSSSGDATLTTTVPSRVTIINVPPSFTPDETLGSFPKTEVSSFSTTSTTTSGGSLSVPSVDISGQPILENPLTTAETLNVISTSDNPDSSMSVSPIVDSSFIQDGGPSIQPSANTVTIETISTSENMASDPIAVKITQPNPISVVSENDITFPSDSFTFPITDTSASSVNTITKTSNTDSLVTLPDINTNEIITVDSVPSSTFVTEVSETPVIDSVSLTPEPTLPVIEVTGHSANVFSDSSNTNTIIDNTNLNSAIRFPGISSISTMTENPSISPIDTESISRGSDPALDSTILIPPSVSTVTTTVIEKSTINSDSRFPDASSSVTTISGDSTANLPSDLEPVVSSTSTIIDRSTLDSVPRFPESTTIVETLPENPIVESIDSNPSVININVDSGPAPFDLFPNSAASMTTTVTEKSTTHSDAASVIDNSGTDVTFGISESAPIIEVNLVPTIDGSGSSSSLVTETSTVDLSLPAITPAVNNLVNDLVPPVITETVNNVLVNSLPPVNAETVSNVLVDSVPQVIAETIDNALADSVTPVITETVHNVVDSVPPVITAAVDNVDNTVVDSSQSSSDPRSSSSTTTITIETSKTTLGADNSYNTNIVDNVVVDPVPPVFTGIVDNTVIDTAPPVITTAVENVVVDPIPSFITETVHNEVVDPIPSVITETVDNTPVDTVPPAITAAVDNVGYEPVPPVIVDNVDTIVVDSSLSPSDSTSTITKLTESTTTTHGGSDVATLSSADNSFSTHTIDNILVDPVPPIITVNVDNMDNVVVDPVPATVDKVEILVDPVPSVITGNIDNVDNTVVDSSHSSTDFTSGPSITTETIETTKTSNGWSDIGTIATADSSSSKNTVDNVVVDSVPPLITAAVDNVFVDPIQPVVDPVPPVFTATVDNVDSVVVDPVSEVISTTVDNAFVDSSHSSNVDNVVVDSVPEVITTTVNNVDNSVVDLSHSSTVDNVVVDPVPEVITTTVDNVDNTVVDLSHSSTVDNVVVDPVPEVITTTIDNVDNTVVDLSHSSTVDNIVGDPVPEVLTTTVDNVDNTFVESSHSSTVDNIVVDSVPPVITTAVENIVVDPVPSIITPTIDNVDNSVVDSSHSSSDSKSGSTITTITEITKTTVTTNAVPDIGTISTVDNSFNAVSDSSISVFPGTETSAVETSAVEFPGSAPGMTETTTITEANTLPGTENAITDSSFAMFPGTSSMDSSTSSITSSSTIDQPFESNTETFIADATLGTFPGTAEESSKDLGAFPGTSAAEFQNSLGTFSTTSTTETSKELGAFPGTSAAEFQNSLGKFTTTSTTETSKELGAFPGTSAAEFQNSLGKFTTTSTTETSKDLGAFPGTSAAELSTTETSKDLGAFPGTSAAELSKLTVGEISKFTHSVNDGSPQIVVFPGTSTSNAEEMTFPNTGGSTKTVTTITETTSTSSNGFTDVPVVEGTFMDNSVVMDTKGSATDVRTFPDSTGLTITSQDIQGSGTTNTDIVTVDNTQRQDFTGTSDGQQMNMIVREDPMGSGFSESSSVTTHTVTGTETMSTTNSQDTGTNTAIVDSSFASFPEGEPGMDTFADSRTVKQIMPVANAAESSSVFSSTISSNAMEPNLGDPSSSMSFSLTVQGGEQPIGPNEFPPPPPVFPAGDISSIPPSEDAALFGTIETGTLPGSEISSAGSSSSSSFTSSSSSSSSSSGFETVPEIGGSTSTVEVTKFESSGVNANSIPEFPAGENAAAIAPSAGIYQRGNGLVMAVLDLTNADKNNLGEMMQILQSLIDERRRDAAAPVDTLPSDAMFPAVETASSVTSTNDMFPGGDASSSVRSTKTTSSVTSTKTSETSASSFPGVEPVFPGAEIAASSSGITGEITGNVPMPTLPPDGAAMFPGGEASSSFSSSMTSSVSSSSFPGVEPSFPGTESLGNPGGVPINRWPTSGF